MRKLFFILLALLLSAPYAEARCKQSTHKAVRSAQRDNPGDDPIEEVREQLEEYAALPFDEKRARTGEITDYIGLLFDKIFADTESEGQEQAGPDVSSGDTGPVLGLINQYRPAITT